ncbi:hypothetical protein EDD15DRAFT_89962 [Pisolithus albus]|nr:hypothetical protein EDD15DRAFT_89962 [Pisolithus albus]
MELNFLCWLYIQVMRILQSMYWFEPAGSHGVGGLNDYHFLPFLFRSAQLRGHKYLRLKVICDNEVVDELVDDNTYVHRSYQVYQFCLCPGTSLCRTTFQL